MSSNPSTETTAATTNNLDTLENFPSYDHELGYQQMLLCSAIIGIAGGLVATAYYYVLEACIHLVWHKLPDFL